MEQTGGEVIFFFIKDAFINIKYMIPTYESCMINWSKTKYIGIFNIYNKFYKFWFKIYLKSNQI